MEIEALVEYDEKFKDYIEYLDRTDRTLKLGRLELHKKAMSRNVARHYGLDDNDIKTLENIFKEEQE